jgi:arylsulfatase A-like enzyme
MLKATAATIWEDNTLHVGPQQWNRHFKRRLKLGSIPNELDTQQKREWVYQKYMKAYLRCVASVDDNVGRVLDYLDDAGLAENTIVVYTSDQGFFLGDHGLYDKRFMYEESLRMPLLIRYPKAIKAAGVSEDMVLNLDFSATFLDFAGTGIPADIQGESFKDIALGQIPDNWRNAMFYKFYETGLGVPRHQGIRTDRFKLIRFESDTIDWELYDLKKDPNELNNLYNDSEYASTIDGLKKKMTALQERYKDTD